MLRQMLLPVIDLVSFLEEKMDGLQVSRLSETEGLQQ